MKKQNRNLLYTFLYLIALYLGIKMLPISDWIKIEYIAFIVKSILFLFVIILSIYEASKLDKIKKIDNRVSYILLLPLLFACASNILYCQVFDVEKNSIDLLSLCYSSINTILCVIIEEMLFRCFLYRLFESLLKNKNNKNILSILFVSLSFALMHVVNFYGNNPISVLIQIGYTFILGLILTSFVTMYDSIILSIIGHFFFNFLNTDLYSLLYKIDYSLKYIVFSSIIALIGIIYWSIIYIISSRRREYAA